MSTEEERDEDERPSKRRRIDKNAQTDIAGLANNSTESSAPSKPIDSQEELSERLRRVMLCTVCLDLPHPDESYQCTLGHIVCEDCVTRLLAEAMMSRRSAQCPHCRTHISWQDLSKNLVVGQALAEMPKSCSDCDEIMEYKEMGGHRKKECVKRQVPCQYRCLGCKWRGTQADSIKHEKVCKFLGKSSDEILEILAKNDCAERNATKAIRDCFNALSVYRISYDDLDLRWPVHFFRLNTEVRFKSSAIEAFDLSWRLRLKLIVGRGTDCNITFCIRLLSAPQEPLTLKFFITLPSARVKPKQLQDVRPQLQEATFSKAGQSSDFMPLVLNGSNATYRLLAMPRITLRLWMLMD